MASPSSSAKDSRVADPNWHSGLKTLPSNRRSRSATRWDLENRKTLNEPSSVQKARIRSTSQGLSPAIYSWPGGVKILDNRRAPSPQPVSYPDEWHDVNKSLNEVPARVFPTYNTYDQNWMVENFKVLEQPLSRVYTRSPEPPRASSPVVEPTPRLSYFDSQTHQYLPGDGSWASENFKVLDPSDRSIHQHRVYANQSRTGVARFTRDDQWASGLKTMSSSRQRLQPRGWAGENLKSLTEAKPCQANNSRKSEFVVTNTGWDSGLYKTLREVRRTYTHNGQPWLANKSFSGEELRPKKVYDTTGSGWDSGLKALPSTSSTGRISATRAGKGYWDLESRKTLPLSYQNVGGAKSEHRRFVDEPRRQDMLAFHRRMCGVY